MRVALYARVSTNDQNCELQPAELRKHVAARSWSAVDEYVDTGWSGAKANRPALARLMANARKRQWTQCWFESWTGGAVAWSSP